MRYFRLGLVAMSAVVSTASFASYELLLAVDATNGRVVRFDPETGASLGSFGAGYMYSPAKIALDESAGLAYITNYNSSTVQVWNYSLGEIVNEFNVATGCWGITRLTNGNLAVASGSICTIYTTSGSVVSAFSAIGYGCDTDGTNIYISSTGVVRKYSTAGTLLGTMTFGASRNVYETKLRNGTAYCGGGSFGGIIGTFATSTMTGWTEKVVTGFSNSMDCEAIAFGHSTSMYIAGQSSGAGGLTGFTRYNTLSGRFSGSFFGNLAAGTRISGMAVVVAPEPGTWVAFGLGALILLRRRRKHA